MYYVLFILLNRMPLTVLSNVSPYEKLFGDVPNLDYFWVFGCLCFVSTLKQNRSKFHPRVVQNVFLGYPLGQKSYKVLNLDTFQISISRDVVFNEQHFPFHYISSTSPSPLQFFLPIATDYTPPLFDNIPDVFQFSSSHNEPNSQSSSSHISFQPPSLISSHPTSDYMPTLDDILDLSTTSPLRRSTRHVAPPSHLSDYICNVPSSSPWCALIAYSSLPPSHTTLISSVKHLIEPVTCT